MALIDAGVDDVEEADDGIEVYTTPNKLSEIKKKIEDDGFIIDSVEMYQKPKTLQELSSKENAERVLKFLNSIEDHDDVQRVFTNIDIPDEILNQINE